MSKKPAPPKQHPKETSHGSSSHPNRNEHAMSNSEITSLIEKKISEILSKQATQLESETTKLVKQPLQDMDTKLQKLSEEFHSANKDQSQRIENIEKVLSSLQQSQAQLEKNLKREIDRVVEEKVQWIQQRFPLDSGFGAREEKCSEQSGDRNAAHQEELLKLHQQHHQDMLSVINDCCRKLKSGFNRREKPYDVKEIHSVIDDIEQKMVCEILSEIQKTNTHEDLSSFEEALESVKRSGELGFARDDEVRSSALTNDDISAALETFENENFDNWSEELRPTKNAGGGELFEGPQEPIIEEVISKSQGMITGDRGNLYYTDELKKTVDEIMSLADNTENKKDNVDLTSSRPPNAKKDQDIEASLESMMFSGDSSADSKPDSKAIDLDALKSLEAQIASDIAGPESHSETSKKDLKSFDSLIASDFGAAFTSAAFTEDLLSLDAKISAALDEKNDQPAAKSSSDDRHLTSLETRIEKDARGSAGDKEQLKSLEAKLESDITKEATVKVKEEAVGKQTAPAKDQTHVSQSQSAQGAAVKHEPTKEAPKEPTKEAPKEPTKEAPKEPTKEAPKEPTKEAPKEPTKEVPKEPTKEAPKEPTKEAPKEPIKVAPKEPTKEAPKEPIKVAPKEPTKEAPKESPKATPVPVAATKENAKKP